MNKSIMIISVAIAICGCAYFKIPNARLIETQSQRVTHCRLLGVVAETADADRIWTHPARYEMVTRVKARAAQLGATHIVWLHQTDTSAAAQAYRCPDR